MPVSPIVPSVKPRSGQRRVLLLTSESALEAEVRDALWIRQQEKEPGLFFELTGIDPALFSDFLGVLDLLDHVRSGYFDMVHIVPSAATWSRSRHSQTFGATSPPLKILSSGSLFSFASRNRKNQHGQSSSGSCGLGCGAVAPMPFQIHWTQHHFSRRLGRTLCTWSIFHLGTKGVSFS